MAFGSYLAFLNGYFDLGTLSLIFIIEWKQATLTLVHEACFVGYDFSCPAVAVDPVPARADECNFFSISSPGYTAFHGLSSQSMGSNLAGVFLTRNPPCHPWLRTASFAKVESQIISPLCRSSDFVVQNVTRASSWRGIRVKYAGPKHSEKLLAKNSLWIQLLNLRRGGTSLLNTTENYGKTQVGFDAPWGSHPWVCQQCLFNSNFILQSLQWKRLKKSKSRGRTSISSTGWCLMLIDMIVYVITQCYAIVMLLLVVAHCHSGWSPTWIKTMKPCPHLWKLVADMHILVICVFN